MQPKGETRARICELYGAEHYIYSCKKRIYHHCEQFKGCTWPKGFGLGPWRWCSLNWFKRKFFCSLAFLPIGLPLPPPQSDLLPSITQTLFACWQFPKISSKWHWQKRRKPKETSPLRSRDEHWAFVQAPFTTDTDNLNIHPSLFFSSWCQAAHGAFSELICRQATGRVKKKRKPVHLVSNHIGWVQSRTRSSTSQTCPKSISLSPSSKHEHRACTEPDTTLLPGQKLPAFLSYLAFPRQPGYGHSRGQRALSEGSLAKADRNALLFLIQCRVKLA